MIKMNLLAFTLMITVHKRHKTSEEWLHEQRIQRLQDELLDRKINMRHYM
ncbi:MAG TPA: YrzI family small protein [Sporolactobacillaceae bacterium]|nr:YrzI family small protein [Sporolactobacillaceae bacterium]